ncbi:MAG: hypothetical protein PHW60_09375 [Kiritimatiellae bacterium]|nr:hypothetical protein [Kiritimatiellia bacterium]
METKHKRKFFRRNLTAFYVIAIPACFLSATYAMTTWTGGTGDWSAPGNWSSGVPADGSDAVITNGSVLLTNATANLASLTISNAMLTFSNWDAALSATNIIIQNNATVTHVTNSASTTNALGEWPADGRVWVVCTNFDLQAGGQINAFGRGYRGGVVSTESGYGPGKGTVSPSYYGGGAGHGGKGGMASVGYPGGIYDQTNAPIWPGSGGGGERAGAGGGAVRIDASNGPVTINGIINVDAKGSTLIAGVGGGGGSGGSIYITCGTFRGATNGLLTAKGGLPGSNKGGGNGGGGRIALIYDTAAQVGVPCAVRFNVSESHATLLQFTESDIGTLYLPDTTLLTTNWSNFEDVRIYGVSNFSLDTLSISNAFVVLGESRVALTVANAVTIDTATLKLGSGITPTEYVQFNCGFLALVNTGALFIYSGPTNDVITNYGAHVSVTNDILVSGNTWIYPVSDNTNGGSVLFSARNVTISEGGGFNANGLGYKGGYYYGTQTNGYGPGGGSVSPNSQILGGGAGYGGGGGTGIWIGRPSRNASCGSVYPWTNAPLSAGSGGGGQHAPRGGDGGGLVWIEAAGTFVLDGTIQANGYRGYDPKTVLGILEGTGGAGSGGGIFIVANAFRGASSGVLSACGGSASNSATVSSGSGGGGRIAVWHRISKDDQQTILANPDNAHINVPGILIATNFVDTRFEGSCVVSNGWSYLDQSANGQPGTIVRLTVPPPKGMIFSIH